MKILPTEKYNTNFGILKEMKNRSYGLYLWGEYKGKKIEIFDAVRDKQKLIYVSEQLRFVKSKLIYWVDNVKKITRAERKTL